MLLADCHAPQRVIEVGANVFVDCLARAGWQTSYDLVLVLVVGDVRADHYIALDAGVEEGGEHIYYHALHGAPLGLCWLLTGAVVDCEHEAEGGAPRMSNGVEDEHISGGPIVNAPEIGAVGRLPAKEAVHSLLPCRGFGGDGSYIVAYHLLADCDRDFFGDPMILEDHHAHLLLKELLTEEVFKDLGAVVKVHNAEVVSGTGEAGECASLAGARVSYK